MGSRPAHLIDHFLYGIRQRLSTFWFRQLLYAVGEDPDIAPSVTFEYPHKISLGNSVQIRHGAVLIGRSDRTLGITLADGVRIKEYAYLDAYGGAISLGRNVRVGHHTVLAGHGGLVFEDDAGISGLGYVVAADHVYQDPSKPVLQQPETKRGIRIGSQAWIGAGAVILDGVEVGRHAVIGAGAVVRTDVPDYCLAVGVPAKPVGDIRTFRGE